MNLGDLHQYLGKLIEDGIDPALPVASMSDDRPAEICDVQLLCGMYYYDPSPKMVANVRRQGAFLVLLPIGEDVSDQLNEGTLREIDLPDVPVPGAAGVVSNPL